MKLSLAAAKWLTKHSIMPTAWAIQRPEEQERIARSNIGLAIFYAPASQLDLSLFAGLSECKYLIAIDASYLDSGRITPDQQVGIILHELGHVFNVPPYDITSCMKSQQEHNLEAEQYADYYTHHCGYGAPFAGAMKHMKDTGVHGFDSPEIDSRIADLTSSISEKLNLA